MTILAITADSSANRKLLNKFKRSGLITYEFVNLENAKKNEIADAPAFFTLNISSLNGEDVLAPSGAIDMSTQLKAILGGGRHNLNDRRQLLAHYYMGNDVFLTGDKDDMIKNRKKLKEVDITVIYNDELEEFIENWGKK